MNVEIRPLERQAVEHVIANLWERGQIEARRFGFETGQPLVDAVAGLANEHAFSIYSDDEPVVVCGAVPLGDNHWRTWFLATDAFTAQGVRLTKLVRDYLHQQVKLHPDATLEAISASDHPEAVFWFRVIGFRPFAEKNGMKVYRYVPH